jgi:hypothetical protein
MVWKLQCPILQYTFLYTVQIRQFVGESCTGGNQADGKTSNSGQIVHEVSDQERYPGRPLWVLLVRVTL